MISIYINAFGKKEIWDGDRPKDFLPEAVKIDLTEKDLIWIGYLALGQKQIHHQTT